MTSIKLKTCITCKKEFTASVNELAMYERLQMPPAKECFYCGTKRKLAFWVSGKFRKGKSDLSGERLITVLPAKVEYPIYLSHEWFSDSWEPKTMMYDAKRPFLEQFRKLQRQIPRPHQTGKNSVGCEWCDDVWDCKNCYLSRSMVKCENASYSYRIAGIKDSIDITYAFDTEQSYDCLYCFKCFNVRHSFNCRDTLDSVFCFDCRNAQHCFMCWNLHNKQYCIRNEQYTKEGYETEIKKYDLGSRKVIDGLREEFEVMLKEKAVRRENFNFKVTNCTGNYITNCNRCEGCFYWEIAEECYNGMRGGFGAKSCIDLVGCFDNIERAGNAVGIAGGYEVKYSAWSNGCCSIEYCDECIDCEHCFGCVGLKKKKFCILNTQYAEEEYKKLRSVIVESMNREGVYGDFFPYTFAPCGYNRSLAQIYFPEDKDTAQAHGAIWEDEESKKIEGMNTSELPDNIKDVKDEIVTQPLICPETGYLFNIASSELAFYRAKSIPLPRLHFDARTLHRFSRIVAIVPYPYACIYCKKNIDAYYPPEFGYQRVACIECYQKELA